MFASNPVMRFLSFSLWMILITTTTTTTSADARAGKTAVLVDEFVFEEAPFRECHASTIESNTDGTLVAAWFGGSHEKHPDVGIWVSHRLNDRWTDPVEVADGVQSPEKRFPTWNPVLFQPKDGPLMLFFKVGPDPDDWWGEWVVSHDGGRSWTDRRRLPDNGIGPVKNKPIQRPDGSIWCPSSTEHDGWRVHLEVTTDLGKSFRRIGPINDRDQGAIQPSLLTYSDGRLQMLCRDQRGRGNVWQTWSEDGGESWSRLESTGLPNPNAGTDAVTLKDGRQLLVYNHTVRGGTFPQGRQMLNVAVSDDGCNWSAASVLERSKGEYSYPAVIQTDDGVVHVTYTWKRRRIKYVAFDPAKLPAVPIRDGKWPQSADL